MNYEFESEMDRGPLGAVLKISRFVGMAPYIHAPEFQVSSILATCGKIFISINGILVVLSVVEDIYATFDMMSASSAIQIISCLLSATLAAATVLGVFTAPARITRIADYLEKLNQLTKKLSKNPERTFQKKNYYKTIFLIGGLLVFLFIGWAYQFTTYPNLTYGARTISVLYVFNLYLLTLLHLQIMFFAKIVKSYLIALNKNLLHLICDGNIEGENTTDNLSTKIRDGRTITRTPQKLRELATLYQLICEIVLKTSEADGAVLLLFLAFVTLFLEVNIYYGIVMGISDLSMIGIVQSVVLPLLFALYGVVLTIIFVEQFHQTHCEMERTNLLIKNRKSIEEGVEVEHELELFHRMIILNKVRYSPLDLFTIDRELMMKLFSVLITYLVITIEYGAETKTVFVSNVTES